MTTTTIRPSGPRGTSPTHDSAGALSRRAVVAGRVLGGLVLALLTLDAIGKLTQPDAAVEGAEKLGFDASVLPVLGTLLLIGIALHLIPRTAFLGAVWITAYLGGAVCANVRAEEPLFSATLAPCYVAVILWAGFYLRSTRIRDLVWNGR